LWLNNQMPFGATARPNAQAVRPISLEPSS
jgi:hypothetical protein